MRFPLKLLSLAALGAGLLGAAPAEADGRRHGRGGYWVDPPPRYVPGPPRRWHGPPRGYGYYAPPPRVYYPPPRVYYPPPRYYAPPPPSAGFYFRF